MRQWLKNRFGERGTFFMGLLVLLILLYAVAALWWFLPARPRAIWKMPGEPHDFRIEPDGRTMSVLHDRGITSWDVETGTERILWPAPRWADQWSQLEAPWLLDGQTLANVNVEAHRLVVWSLPSSTGPIEIPEVLRFIGFSPDGKTAIVEDERSEVKLVEVSTGKARRCHPWGDNHYPTFVQLGSGDWISLDEPWAGILTVWDPFSETKWCTLTGVDGQLVFSRDGRRMASHKDGAIALWELPRGDNSDRLVMPGQEVFPCLFSPDGSRLITETLHHQVSVWDVTTRPATRIPLVVTEYIDKPGYSPDGKWLGFRDSVTGGMEKWVVKDTTTFEDRGIKYETLIPNFEVEKLPFFRRQQASVFLNSPIRSAEESLSRPGFAPDSRTVACASDMLEVPSTMIGEWLGHGWSWTTGVRLWDLASAQELATFKGCTGFAYFPDGKSLATFLPDGTVQVWDVPPRRQLWVEISLPVLFALVLSLGCCYLVWMRKQRPLPALPAESSSLDPTR